MINVIAAVGPWGEMGSENSLPWGRIDEDMRHFAEITAGSTVIMGRKTYESIRKPLKGRRNIVVSSTLRGGEDIEVCKSLSEAIDLAGASEVFVIGGRSLYEEALPLSARVYLTRVPQSLMTSLADTFFPMLSLPAVAPRITKGERVKFELYEVASKADSEYLWALARIMRNGSKREDRTGTGTRSLFGERCVYDLTRGFPLLTTKRVFWRGVVEELLWFLKGSTNANALQDKGVHIWDEWAGPDGELGPIYGKQWRDWNGVDQVQALIDGIKENPSSRRHIVSAWNVSDLDQMALPPCHTLFQFYVHDGYLDCSLYQRSADMFLGVPFNIASYALLTHIIGALTGLKPRRFVHFIGDAHIYSNHTEQVRTQTVRKARPAPRLVINPIESLDELTSDHIQLVGYDPHPSIKGAVSV
jgi:thymidylate synthase